MFTFEPMELFVHELVLPETSDFSKRFNRVSEAFMAWEEAIGTDEEDRLWKEYMQMKYCLEQGIGA